MATKAGPFKDRIEETSKVAHVFWVVANAERKDGTRVLDSYEVRNVALKAVEAQLMREVKPEGRADPGFRLTAGGRRYYDESIAKYLPPGFVSDRPLMTSTYYHSFPSEPRQDSNLVHVFWVVYHDHRVLSERERRNVIYPAVAAGLVVKAPLDSDLIARRRDGKPSKSRFMLTETGERYYREIVKPMLPDGFTSDTPPVSRTRRAKVVVD